MQPHPPVQLEMVDVVREEHHDRGPFTQRVKSNPDAIAGDRTPNSERRHGSDYRGPDKYVGRLQVAWAGSYGSA